MYLVLDPVPVASRLNTFAAAVICTGNASILQASSACAIGSNFFLTSCLPFFTSLVACGAWDKTVGDRAGDGMSVKGPLKEGSLKGAQAGARHYRQLALLRQRLILVPDASGGVCNWRRCRELKRDQCAAAIKGSSAYLVQVRVSACLRFRYGCSGASPTAFFEFFA